MINVLYHARVMLPCRCDLVSAHHAACERLAAVHQAYGPVAYEAVVSTLVKYLQTGQDDTTNVLQEVSVMLVLCVPQCVRLYD